MNEWGSISGLKCSFPDPLDAGGGGAAPFGATILSDSSIVNTTSGQKILKLQKHTKLKKKKTINYYRVHQFPMEQNYYWVMRETAMYSKHSRVIALDDVESSVLFLFCQESQDSKEKKSTKMTNFVSVVP